jgi:fructose-1,6-bisphosphatase I
MSNMRHWDAPVRRYIDEVPGRARKAHAARTSTCAGLPAMVADVHRILSRAAASSCTPGTSASPNKPGKLRLMYEANPMSWLIEQAGGAATNGRQRILDIQPTQLHERVSVILGSRNEVERVTSYHAQTPA